MSNVNTLPKVGAESPESHTVLMWQTTQPGHPVIAAYVMAPDGIVTLRPLIASTIPDAAAMAPTAEAVAASLGAVAVLCEYRAVAVVDETVPREEETS